jgi:Putative peptidoglycan binding domain
VRERRAIGRRPASGPAGPIGAATAVGQRLWATVTRRPVDTVAILGAAAATLIIVINAVWLQSEPRPAPFFANPPSIPQSADNHAAGPAAKPADSASTRSGLAQRTAQVVSSRRNDPIAELIGTSFDPSSTRVAAVQRVLSAYGYGQIRPSGIVDEPTSAAIEKFQSEHKMSVTGQISDQLLSGLAAMIGHPVE